MRIVNVAGNATASTARIAGASWKLTVTSWSMSAEKPVGSGVLYAERKDTFHGLL